MVIPASFTMYPIVNGLIGLLRHNKRPRAVGQNHMLALTNNSESALLQNAYGLKMINARQLWHS